MYEKKAVRYAKVHYSDTLFDKLGCTGFARIKIDWTRVPCGKLV